MFYMGWGVPGGHLTGVYFNFKDFMSFFYWCLNVCYVAFIYTFDDT